MQKWRTGLAIRRPDSPYDHAAAFSHLSGCRVLTQSPHCKP